MTRILFFLKALESGERWITVHSKGDKEGRGQPILIKPSPGGGYSVIGGAGGSLNHLKLTNVKSEGSYVAEAKSRAQGRKEEAKRQTASDKKHGLTASKAKIAEGLKAELGDARVKFVQAVAKIVGWKDEDLRFKAEDVANKPPSVRAAAEKKHAAMVMQAASDAVDYQRNRLVADAEARSESGLGEIPLTSSKPEQLSVQDLDPVEPNGAALGFAADYSKRAAARGATKETIKAEAEASREPLMPDEQAAKDKRQAKTAEIAKQMEMLRDPLPPISKKLVDARDAVEMMKAAKQLAAVRGSVRKKLQTLKADTVVEPQAYQIETVAAPVDADVVKTLEDDLRTLRTRGFLNELAKTANGRDLGGYVGAGAYNAINAAALTAGGASLVDRSVVDVLGIAGAAQVLARRLKADLTSTEMTQLTDAMGAFHVDRYMALSQEALGQAKDLHEMAHEIELGDVASTDDIVAAQELNAKRRDCISQAQQILGTAAGEMEADAAMVAAFNQKPKDTISVSLGKTTREAALTQLHAIGLDKGDFTLDSAGASTLVTVHGPGLDKLAKPVARAELESTRESLAIINGERDEDGWLPDGLSHRAELAMSAPEGVAPRLAKPFKLPSSTGDMHTAIGDYLGGRTADGDSPADVMAGLLAEAATMSSANREAFMGAVNQVAPLYDADGKMVRVESYADTFNKMADDFVERTYGADRTPLQKQQFKVDKTAMEALHGALAAHPDGIAAFKPVGDLSSQDEGALRKTFLAEYGRIDPEAEKLRQAVEALDKQQPEKESQGLFGVGPNPDHAAWQVERDAAAAKANAAAMTWPRYVKALGSPQAAYAALQDVVKSRVLEAFASNHNKANPDTPLRVGRQVISNDLAHLEALDPKARAARGEQQARLVDSLRTRIAGRYASGSVAEKMEAARVADEAAEQSQMGLFGQEAAPETAQRPLALGERHTLGHAAERQVAAMMATVGPNFRPGEPLKLIAPSMSGKFIARQRAVKLIEHNKRTVLAMGVGSGKTSVALSAFTDLKGKGKAKKGLYLVPSVVQGQFHAEAIKMLEPGKFRWHADPSASREQRLAAYKDPANDFAVVTHQAFREDFDHVAMQAHGMTAEAFDAMTPIARKDYAKRLMTEQGWNTDFLGVDEGHNLLNRRGKANSHLANVVDAISSSTPYYVNATADPVKNDVSEAADLLAKMDPDKHGDTAAFMRKYSANTSASQDAMRREMARYIYTSSIDPGVKAERREVPVSIAGQGDGIKALDEAVTRARLARMRGETDVEAMKVLAPAAFDTADPAQHEAVAKRLQTALAMIHGAAVQHAIDDGAKTDRLAQLAGERKGKPGVVFAHRLDRVQEIAKRLEGEGHRVVTLTGSDSSAEKDRKREAYQAGKFDIMVASDAGAVGANLQHGKWLVQYDTPLTSMLHAQRQGRINRIGQTGDVELLDLVADHPSETRARKRLAKKYELREMMTSPFEGLDETGLASYIAQARAGKLASERPALDVGEFDKAPEPGAGPAQRELAA